MRCLKKEIIIPIAKYRKVMLCQICNMTEATTTATIASKKKQANVTYQVCAKCAQIMNPQKI